MDDGTIGMNGYLLERSTLRIPSKWQFKSFDGNGVKYSMNVKHVAFRGLLVIWLAIISGKANLILKFIIPSSVLSHRLILIVSSLDGRCEIKWTSFFIAVRFFQLATAVKLTINLLGQILLSRTHITRVITNVYINEKKKKEKENEQASHEPHLMEMSNDVLLRLIL